MKKFLALTLVVVTVFTSGLFITDMSTEANAESLPEGYIAVSTCKDLESIGRGENYPGSTHKEAWALDANYKLANDIDCSATNPDSTNHDTTDATTYGADGFDPIALSLGNQTYFSGHFNGQGYAINDLFINRKVSKNSSKIIDNIGLFSTIASGGEVENLTMNSVQIKGNFAVGGVVGKLKDGTIKNTVVTGKIRGKDYLGGLAGWTSSGHVENSGSKANVTIFDDSTGNGIGGLIGFAQDSTIKNSYASGQVKGDSSVGGLIGATSKTELENIYAAGDVYGEALVGGLIGNVDRTNIAKTYAAGNVNAYEYGGGLVGLISGSTVESALIMGNVVNGEEVVGKWDYSAPSTQLSKCYTFENQKLEGSNPDEDLDFPNVSREQLTNPSWYKDTLGFDSNWKVNIVKDGYYPHVMKTDSDEQVQGQKKINIRY